MYKEKKSKESDLWFSPKHPTLDTSISCFYSNNCGFVTVVEQNITILLTFT